MAKPWSCARAPLSCWRVPRARSKWRPESTTSSARKQQRVGEDHYTFDGAVEIKLGNSEIYADKAELFNEQDRAL
jgi:lipopolysaccharide export system protein LptA